MSTIKGTWKTGNPPKKGVYRLWCQKGGNQSDPERNPWYSWWNGTNWSITGSPEFVKDHKATNGHQFAYCQWRWLDESADRNWMSRGPTQPTKPGVYKVRAAIHRDNPNLGSWMAYWNGLKWGGATECGDPKIAMKYYNQGDTLESRADEWLNETPTQPTVETPKKRQVGVHRCHFINASKEPRFAIWLETDQWSHAYPTIDELRSRWNTGIHQEDSLIDDGYIGPWPEHKPIVPEPKAKYIAGQMYTFMFPNDKKTYFVQFCENNQFGLCEESYDAAKSNKKGIVTIQGAEMSWGMIVPAKIAVEIVVSGFYDVSFKGQKRVVVYSLGNGKCSGYSKSIESARYYKHQHDNYKLPGEMFSDPRLLLAEMLDEEPKPEKPLPALKVGMYEVGGNWYAWWDGEQFGWADLMQHGFANAYLRRHERENTLDQDRMIKDAMWANWNPPDQIVKNQKEPMSIPAPQQIKAAVPPRRKAPARRRVLLLS